MSAYYPRKYGRYVTGGDDSNTIAAIDFTDGTVTLSPGTGPVSFTRSGTKPYAESNDDNGMVYADPDTVATEAFQYNGSSTDGGAFFGGSRKNWILDSEDFSTASWTNIGLGSVTNGAGIGPFGAFASLSRFDAVAGGDGQFQNTTIAAASRRATFTLYVLRSGGADVSGVIYLEGASGGTPETASVAFTATSTWQRLEITTLFTAAATGLVQCQYTLDVLGTSIFVFGAMVTFSQDATFGEQRTGPCAYVSTTAAVGNDSADVMTIPASNVTPAAGGFSCWVNVPYIGTSIFSNSKYIVDMAGGTDVLSLRIRLTTGIFQIMYNGANGALGTTVAQPNTWYHVVGTFFNTATSARYRIIVNGVQENTTTTVQTTQTAATLSIGGVSAGTNNRYLDGIVSRFKSLSGLVSVSKANQIFEAERSYYGV